MTRPSKLFVGKMYVAANSIADAFVEAWPEDNRHKSMATAPQMKPVLIEAGSPAMFLKRETKTVRNSEWNWSNSQPLVRRKYFLFLINGIVVHINKKRLSSFHKLVPGRTRKV